LNPAHTREIRARCYLDAGGEPVWTLRQSDKQVYSTHPTEVRNLKEVKVSDDIETFMEILGAKYVSLHHRFWLFFEHEWNFYSIFLFRFQYEYLKVGVRTVVRLEKCKAEIIITKIKRLQEKGNINSGVDIDPTRYHVELGAVALEKDIQSVSQELTSFATQLFPYG
jgi:hypothetical protein